MPGADAARIGYPWGVGPLVAMSLVWLFCLGGLGIFFPLYSLYLRESAGLTGTQVGAVMAMLPLLGLAAQPFWGQVADRTGSRTGVLAVLMAGAALGYAGLALADGFVALLLQTAALAFFSTAMIPSCVAVTLAFTRDASPHAFGLVRVWGTIGFLFWVVAFPRILDAYQAARGLRTDPDGAAEPGLALMFPLTAAVVAAGALLTLFLPRGGAVSLRAPRGDWRRLLRHGPYVRLLLFTLVAYFSFQGPMTFFPVYVAERGGNLDTVSEMWVFMLILEIPLVALSGASLARLGARGLIAVAVVSGGVRWTVCGFATAWYWIYPVQMLHGVVVAGLVIGAPLYIEAAVPERLRSTAQGLAAMVGISVGGITSNLGTGWLVDHMGADAPYRVGGLLALGLAALLPFVLPPPSRPEAAPDELEPESPAPGGSPPPGVPPPGGGISPT